MLRGVIIQISMHEGVASRVGIFCMLIREIAARKEEEAIRVERLARIT